MINFFCIIFLLFCNEVFADEEGPDFIANVYEIQKGDTLYEIAYEFDLGLDEILRANPQIQDVDFVNYGQKIILPTTHIIPKLEKREGIVINLAEPRMYFFFGNEIETFPVAIGADEKTPLGETKIIRKRKNPAWIPPLSIREENPELPEIIPAGPDNPLGKYALNLDYSQSLKWKRVIIHGTNLSTSIGGKVSHGCIRLYPWDIEELFLSVKIGTPVKIVSQPVKVDEVVGAPYLEVHAKKSLASTKKLICERFSDCEDDIDWVKVEKVLKQKLGVPFMIGVRD